MAKTDLQLKTLAQATGKSITTTLTYVNPEANSATLKEFAQKLNNLTTNTYVETNRVQSINVDTEQVPITKKDQQITIHTPWERTTVTGGNTYETASVTGAVGTVAVQAKRTDNSTPITALYTGATGYLEIPANTIGLTYYNGVPVEVTLIASGNNEYNPAIEIITLTE